MTPWLPANAAGVYGMSGVSGQGNPRWVSTDAPPPSLNLNLLKPVAGGAGISAVSWECLGIVLVDS